MSQILFTLFINLTLTLPHYMSRILYALFINLTLTLLHLLSFSIRLSSAHEDIDLFNLLIE